MDELSDRNYALSQMTEFPSFQWYAYEWEKLAADAEALGRLYLAESCRSRAKHYLACVGQTVIRLLQYGEIKLIELDNSTPETTANSLRPLADVTTASTIGIGSDLE